MDTIYEVQVKICNFHLKTGDYAGIKRTENEQMKKNIKPAYGRKGKKPSYNSNRQQYV